MRDTLDSGAPEPEGFRIGGRHVLAAFIVFFGIIFAVNGYMLARALATHSGVVAVEPYRKGLAYNERIRAGDRQAELGWRDEMQLVNAETLAVTITDRDGKPVSSLALSAVIGRPSTVISDRSVELSETNPGSYTANVAALQPGAWLVSLEVKAPDQTKDPIYRAKRRLWLKP